MICPNMHDELQHIQIQLLLWGDRDQIGILTGLNDLRVSIPIFNMVGGSNHDQQMVNYCGLILSSVPFPLNHPAAQNSLTQEKRAMLHCWKKTWKMQHPLLLYFPSSTIKHNFKRSKLENGECWTRRPFPGWNPVVRYWRGQSLNELVDIQFCFQWGIKFMFWRQYP